MFVDGLVLKFKVQLSQARTLPLLLNNLKLCTVKECQRLESSADWDDHQRIFGFDGQDFQYPGAQVESLPYVYYTPSYGYSQSAYNPYNPYIPGAMMGADVPFLVAQQYYTIPSYENAISSPAYFPMVVQSIPDINSNIPSAPTAIKADGPVFKNKSSPASAISTLNPQRNASSQATLPRVPEGSKANVVPSKQPLNGKGAQVIDNVSHGKAWSNRIQRKVAVPPGNALSSFGSSAHGRAMDKTRPTFQFGRVPNDVNGSPDALTEQNRGPRTNKSKNHLAVKAYTSKAGDTDAEGNIIIHTDQYNKDDFPIDYLSARFFVIKSYSEDDVHKSIKYNVWSSTPNGNKKLHILFEDAQKVAAGKQKSCPIFLFFSVNASGQFCGVAEMTGPVNFHKDMDFWQQDKWSGSFPVRWHIIKDVPNPNFRHIILENNENKPVTNSRDTQEVRYKKGMEMLKIFKNYTSKTSVLDDFMYYENRQKILQEEKTKLLLKNYGSPFLAPIIDPPRKKNMGLDLTCSKDEKKIELSDLNNSEKKAVTPTELVSLDFDVSSLTDSEKNDMHTLKFGSLSINPNGVEPKPLKGATNAANVTSVANSEPVNVVRIGSVPVKVNGFAKSSGFLTVGTIPLDTISLGLEETSEVEDLVLHSINASLETGGEIAGELVVLQINASDGFKVGKIRGDLAGKSIGTETKHMKVSEVADYAGRNLADEAYTWEAAYRGVAMRGGLAPDKRDEAKTRHQ
ncbi:hypothetical protein LguiA_031312 [Lonicera macranthoides]